LQDALAELQQTYQQPVNIIATGAARRPDATSFERLRQQLQSDDQHHLLLLGTGWGLADEIFEQATTILEPIQGCGNYNHLPVRSALAIMLDRLLGER
jgi:hypothetical protein